MLQVANPMRNKTLLASLAAFALALVLSAVTALLLTSLLERRTQQALDRAFASASMPWVASRVDGLSAHLSGTAPSESQRIRALRVAGEIVDASRITETIEVPLAEGLVAPVFRLELMRNRDDLSVIGLVPARGDGGPVVEQLLEAMPDAAISDMLQTADHAVPQGWVPAVRYALQALTRFDVGRISVSSGRIEVEALVNSEPERAALETALRADAPVGQVLALSLVAPRPVVSPFLFRLDRETEGAFRVGACSADTEVAVQSITDALRAAGYQGRLNCPLALGAPSPRWGEAVSQGIAALGAVGAGSLVVSDASVTLIVPHDTAAPAFDGAVGRLQSGLPPAFVLTAQRADPPDTEAATGTGPVQVQAILSEDGRISITGQLPNERIRDAVSAFARARFGTESTQLGVRLVDGLPTGWAVRVLTGIEAVSELHHGAVTIQPDTLRVTGRSGNPDVIEQVTAVVLDALGADAALSLDVVYDEALDPVAQAPTPDRCEARIHEILAQDKITFDPGSTTINAAAGRIIDRIAEVFQECGELPFEVAGYTDSQGREETNAALSQARAASVISALLERRVLVSQLRAVGYGEANPIADNDTEEGREANRRIEFTLIRPEPAPEPYDPALEAELVIEAQDAAAETPRPRARPEQN